MPRHVDPMGANPRRAENGISSSSAATTPAAAAVAVPVHGAALVGSSPRSALRVSISPPPSADAGTPLPPRRWSERACPHVPAPTDSPLPRDRCFDAATGLPDLDEITRHFLAGGTLHPADAGAIVALATVLLREEPNVLLLKDPVTVCGDIHGQFFDLMTLFSVGGDPTTTQYLFLGDYVDRGYFSSEVALLLFAHKIRRPSGVWMLRGNHECRHLTGYFNFREECVHKYSIGLYDAFMAAFDALPLAALLNDSFLCVHGGLSPDIKFVDDISLIDRFREPPTNGAMCDLLWSDPMEDDDEGLCPEALFLHNDLRGCSYVFSHAAATLFLEANDLKGIIRAHEAQDEGYRMFRKVEATGFPSVICVFSAPNYCDSYDNKAAVLHVDGSMLHLRQFHSVPHPYILPNFMNAFSWSMPFVCDRLLEITGVLLAPTRAVAEAVAAGQPLGQGLLSSTTDDVAAMGPSAVRRELLRVLETYFRVRRMRQAAMEAALASPGGVHPAGVSASSEGVAVPGGARVGAAPALLAHFPRSLLLGGGPQPFGGALRRRGRAIRAKVVAVARWCVLLRRLRRSAAQRTPTPEEPRAAVVTDAAAANGAVGVLESAPPCNCSEVPLDIAAASCGSSCAPVPLAIAVAVAAETNGVVSRPAENGLAGDVTETPGR